MSPSLATLVAAAALAATHLFAGRLRLEDRVPRSRWLSFAGGVSVAYVFVHLLPEIARSRHLLESRFSAEEAVFAVALAGLVTFYGLEQAARSSRSDERREGRTDTTPPGVFWTHIASYTLYNAIIGYLLVRRPEGALALYAVAMGLHFLVNDEALHRHHRHRYRRVGRWLLAGAVFAGLALGTVTPLNELVTATLIAFLGGGIVLNVLKEEVPSERESRVWTFALGATVYAALVMLF